MGLLKLSGSIIGGPVDGRASQFPSSSIEVSLGFGVGDSKSFDPCTGVLSRTIASTGPTDFKTLEGVGVGLTVTKGNFLYFKCDSPMLLRVTFDDGAGGDVVAVSSVNGIYACEADDATPIKKLEAQGAGPLEYLVSGNE